MPVSAPALSLGEGRWEVHPALALGALVSTLRLHSVGLLLGLSRGVAASPSLRRPHQLHPSYAIPQASVRKGSPPPSCTEGAGVVVTKACTWEVGDLAHRQVSLKNVLRPLPPSMSPWLLRWAQGTLPVLPDAVSPPARCFPSPSPLVFPAHAGPGPGEWASHIPAPSFPGALLAAPPSNITSCAQ